jgi:hypothetical protein
MSRLIIAHEVTPARRAGSVDRSHRPVDSRIPIRREDYLTPRYRRTDGIAIAADLDDRLTRFIAGVPKGKQHRSQKNNHGDSHVAPSLYYTQIVAIDKSSKIGYILTL